MLGLLAVLPVIASAPDLRRLDEALVHRVACVMINGRCVESPTVGGNGGAGGNAPVIINGGTIYLSPQGGSGGAGGAAIGGAPRGNPAISGACTVADPSPTPLNVRDGPDGQILGALSNGTHVRLGQNRTDARGAVWSYAVPIEGGRAGWVYRKYVSCP
jgi:hypothetical protein